MKISIVYYKQKALATKDEHPILIVISDKGIRKRRSTGVSCKEQYWLSKSNMVSGKDKEAELKNALIREKKIKYEQRASDCFANLGHYDLDIIASEDSFEIKEERHTDNFLDVFALKYQTLHSSEHIRKIDEVKKLLIRLYGDYIAISDINQVWFNNFLHKIRSKPNGSIKQIIKRFLAVYNFARDKGLVEKYVKLIYDSKSLVYKSKAKKSISKFSLTLLWDQISFHMKHTSPTANDFTYRQSNLINATYILFIDFFLQGLSPIDLAGIKIKDIEIIDLYDSEIANLSFSEVMARGDKYKQVEKYRGKKCLVLSDKYRTKTGKKVDIVLDYNDSIQRLFAPYFLDKNGNPKTQDDYLLNVFDKNKSRTDKQIHSRLSNYFTHLSAVIKQFGESSGDIVKNDLINFSYYSVRHTYITIGLQQGIDRSQLAIMAGHSLQEQDTYFGGYKKSQIYENSILMFNTLNEE